MAINTQNEKRSSILFFLFAGLPKPDSVIDSYDKRQILGLYAGLNTSTQPVYVISHEIICLKSVFLQEASFNSSLGKMINLTSSLESDVA